MSQLTCRLLTVTCQHWPCHRRPFCTNGRLISALRVKQCTLNIKRLHIWNSHCHSWFSQQNGTWARLLAGLAQWTPTGPNTCVLTGWHFCVHWHEHCEQLLTPKNGEVSVTTSFSLPKPHRIWQVNIDLKRSRCTLKTLIQIIYVSLIDTHFGYSKELYPDTSTYKHTVTLMNIKIYIGT